MNSWIYPRNPTASPSGLFCYSSVAAVSLCYSPSGRRRRRRFIQCCPNFCEKRSVLPIQFFWGPRTFSLLAPTIPESFTPIGPRICESIAKMPQETHPLMYLTSPPWINKQKNIDPWSHRSNLQPLKRTARTEMNLEMSMYVVVEHLKI